MTFTVTLPNHLSTNETIVIPVSMNQVLEQGARLAAIVDALKRFDYHPRTTILVCDYLNRHNCTNEQEALQQGERFLTTHARILESLHVLRWQDFIATRPKKKYQEKLAAIESECDQSPTFHAKLKKTWEKCLSTSQQFEASIKYQQEEYAALLCMDEFHHLFYPRRISHGMAYIYQHFSEKKPLYHHIRIAENRSATMTQLFQSLKQAKHKHHHVAFRVLLEQMETLLASNELSPKAKQHFAEEAENILMMHGLLPQKIADNVENS